MTFCCKVCNEGRQSKKIRGLLRCLKTAFWFDASPWDSSRTLTCTVTASSLELLFRLLLSQSYCSSFFPNLKCLKESPLHIFTLYLLPKAAQHPPFYEIFFDHSQASQILPSLYLDGTIRHLCRVLP